MHPGRNGRGRWKVREENVLALVGLLVLAVGAILAEEAYARPREQRIARDFQTLVHGAGLGPATDPSECAFAFDPRLADQCPHNTGALPLGSAYCPYHALTIFPYSSLKIGDRDIHLH